VRLFEWASLDERIRAYDDELAALARENQQARQLATIPGIGVISPVTGYVDADQHAL
jgi:transposase